MELDQQHSLPEGLDVVLADVARCFESRGIRYALIGGVAIGIRSQVRATEDLDFIAQIPQLVLPRLLDDLVSCGFEMDLVEVIRRWIQEHMIVLRCRGVRVDLLKPVVPLYQHVIDTARAETDQSRVVRVASAEGLILTKLIAWRTQDQADIERLLAANRGQLDLDYIRREWATVGDDDDPKMQRFEEMIRQFYTPPPASDSITPP